MRFSTFIAAAALISASAATLAVAQTPPAASLPLPAGVSMKPADAPAGAYTLDGRHASVTWRIRHQGVSLFTARFDKIEGKLNFDTADPAKSTVEAVVQTGSVSTNVFNAQGEPAFAKEIANQFLGGEGFNGPLLAGYIQHGHGHLILGERAGFVRADRGDGTEGLNCRQFAN